jgi:DNA invertase Pin-like site-specific DNA recombinase
VKQYISYLRVSTTRQGLSGLGLESQRQTVGEHVADNLVSEFIEIETGTDKGTRPELQKALSYARLHGAVLIVAKVDRLTRSVAFLHTLLESGVEVEFCDLPQVSGPTGRFMLNQMAAVAELEAGLISQRTKAALKAAKARGVVLGRPENATPEGRKLGAQNSAQSRRTTAHAKAMDRLPHIQQIQIEGVEAFSAIARILNNRGIPAPKGGKWQGIQVKRVLEFANE